MPRHAHHCSMFSMMRSGVGCGNVLAATVCSDVQRLVSRSVSQSHFFKLKEDHVGSSAIIPWLCVIFHIFKLPLIWQFGHTGMISLLLSVVGELLATNR